MKTLFAILTCLSVFSCSTGQSQKDLGLTVPNSNSNEFQVADSSVISPPGISLRDILLTQIHTISPWTITNGTIEIDSSSNISADFSLIRYNYSDGVSSTDYIVTFSGDKYLDHEILEQSSDMDLSSSSYSYKRLIRNNGFQFFIVTYNEAVADTNLLDPNDKKFIKTGYSFDQIKTLIDSITVSVIVQTDGHIQRDTIR